MYADNSRSFASTIFTILKLGAAIAVILILGSRFLDMWQSNSGHETIQNAVQEMRSK